MDLYMLALLQHCTIFKKGIKSLMPKFRSARCREMSAALDGVLTCFSFAVLH